MEQRTVLVELSPAELALVKLCEQVGQDVKETWKDGLTTTQNPFELEQQVLRRVLGLCSNLATIYNVDDYDKSLSFGPLGATQSVQSQLSTIRYIVETAGVAVGQSCLSFRMSGAACKREHVVPCNMLTSKAIEMIDDGVSGLFEATIQWTATLKYIIAPQIFQALSGLLASTISLGKVCLAGFQSMPISGQGPLRWS